MAGDFIRYIPISSVVDDYIDLVDVGNTVRLPLKTLYKWAHDVVKKLPSRPQLVHAVKLYKVQDGRIVLDDELESIAMALYRKEPESPTRRGRVVEWVKRNYDGCDIKMNLECPECSDEEPIIIDAEDYWFEWNHPQYAYKNNKALKDWGGLQNFTQRPTEIDHNFKPLRPRASALAGLSKYHVQGCLELANQLGTDDVPQYWIDFPKMFISGLPDNSEVIISSLNRRVDENGYPYIPDLVEVSQAITAYIESRMLYREYKKTRNQSTRVDMRDWEIRYKEAMGQAREKMKMPEISDYKKIAEATLGNMHSPLFGDQVKGYSPDFYTQTMERLTRK